MRFHLVPFSVLYMKEKSSSVFPFYKDLIKAVILMSSYAGLSPGMSSADLRMSPKCH